MLGVLSLMATKSLAVRYGDAVCQRRPEDRWCPGCCLYLTNLGMWRRD